MDAETFEKMWEMSAPGAPSEHCFMRVPQTEYYEEDRAGADCFKTMPDVC
jgi:D-aspartate oxidase